MIRGKGEGSFIRHRPRSPRRGRALFPRAPRTPRRKVHVFVLVLSVVGFLAGTALVLLALRFRAKERTVIERLHAGVLTGTEAARAYLRLLHGYRSLAVFAVLVLPGLLVAVLARAAATDAWDEWALQIALLTALTVVSAVWYRDNHTRVASARARVRKLP